MKYVWIVMLALAYIYWTCISIKDIWRTARFFKAQYVIDNFNFYSGLWIAIHLMIIFTISFSMYLAE